jgi:hypothetical protein
VSEHLAQGYYTSASARAEIRTRFRIKHANKWTNVPLFIAVPDLNCNMKYEGVLCSLRQKRFYDRTDNLNLVLELTMLRDNVYLLTCNKFEKANFLLISTPMCTS